MLLSLTKFKEFRCQILTKHIIRVGTHWIGRSVLCCGDDCPACGLRTARDVYYAGVCFQRQRRVVELPSSFAIVIDEACRELSRENALGIIIAARRYNVRDVWKLDAAEFQPPLSEEFRVVEFAAELARCWRVPTIKVGEELKSWIKRSADSQRSLLAHSQLFV